ncbi:MAG: hypothetical protein IPK07_12320 [Deltaproteobacteria bacterium]|jgi:hypothetical protein|nr:hypothetical protein [Deltaproteobacteria bacterium]
MLSLLASEHFAKSPFLSFAIVALLIFMTVFAAVSIRTLFTRPAQFEAVARLPLEADDD